jgi:hypothetical protein
LIHFQLSDSYKNLNVVHWDLVLNNRNVYLSIPYLSALEDSLAGEIQFHYILFYDSNKKPVGIAVTQTLNFVDKGFTENEQICSLRNKIKKRFVTGNGTYILTCGNPFASGENGFYFEENISVKSSYKALSKALKVITKKEHRERKTSVMLFKEFWAETFDGELKLRKEGYFGFHIDVNMVMQIPSGWKSREDYYNALNTKFRSKAKNAYHKSHDIIVKEFAAADIETYRNDFMILYLSVIAKSPFQFGNLNAESFFQLKKNLGERFVVKGYFLKEKLVGFTTAFKFDSVLDANFVGIDYALNYEFAIYQRMLYDFVDYAILNQCKEIRFGRTAEEIKSSVGALPVQMSLFIKHKNYFTNLILKSIISKTKPSEFELRRPFKVGEQK